MAVHTIEYYSALKKESDNVLKKKKKMNLENILSEIKQTQNYKYRFV